MAKHRKLEEFLINECLRINKPTVFTLTLQIVIIKIIAWSCGLSNKDDFLRSQLLFIKKKIHNVCSLYTQFK